jgi:uncharacterized membrane protein YraQ (UPF0718 family)
MEELAAVGAAFAELMLTVLPWFALGTLTAAAMETFVPTAWAQRVLTGRSRLPAAVATGAVLPGCSCTTMPLAAGLSGMAGPQVGTLTAFVFVSPLLSPITVLLTLSLLGWEMTAARIVAALGGSLAIGVIINRYEGRFRPRRELLPVRGGSPLAESCGEDCSCEPRLKESGSGHWIELGRSARRLLRSVLPYFLIGMLAAAVLSALVPEDAVPSLVGDAGGIWAFALAAVVGIPLYVCEGEEVPLTVGLLAAGLGPGPSLTFLLGSVGTCVPTLLMSRGILGERATAFYLAFWIVFAIGVGAVYQALVL